MLTSVRNLLQQIDNQRHDGIERQLSGDAHHAEECLLIFYILGLAEMLRHHKWVGLANAEMAVLQHRTKLYICKIRPLAYVRCCPYLYCIIF